MTLQVRSVVAGVRPAGEPIAPVLADAAPGWTPVLAAEADGTRTVVKVADWIGGTGSKPATGYIGGSGSTELRSAPGDGFDFKQEAL